MALFAKEPETLLRGMIASRSRSEVALPASVGPFMNFIILTAAKIESAQIDCAEAGRGVFDVGRKCTSRLQQNVRRASFG